MDQILPWTTTACIVAALALPATALGQTPEPPEPASALFSLDAGLPVPNDGLEYGPGLGSRAGFHLASFYLGLMFAAHAGDSKTIGWGSSFSSSAGDQHYSTSPIVVDADFGYRLMLRIGSVETWLTPFLAGGAIFIPVHSWGVYGDSSILETRPAFGGGFSYYVAFGRHWAVGINTRTHVGADIEIEFGDSSEGTYEHGFSTSVFYSSFYAELAYRF